MGINKILFLTCFILLVCSVKSFAGDYCYMPGVEQYRPSIKKYCETETRTCCKNNTFSNWGEACVVGRLTYISVSVPTIVSACSGYGTCPASICNGTVGWRTKYTAHQLTNCDNRAQGNGLSSSKTQGDGSACSDTNYYGVNGGSGSRRPEEAYCNGWTENLPDCDSYYSSGIEEACNNRGYEGNLCVDYWYSSGSTQIFSLPCHQNGIYCYYLGGGSYDSIRLASTGSARVIKCVKE